MVSLYPYLKYVHITAAALSLAIFVVRAVRNLQQRSPVLISRQLPRLIDTLLLISALVLMWMSGFYPGVVDWMSVKLVLVLCYILGGMFTLYWLEKRRAQLFALLFCGLCFAAIVFLALNKPEI